MSFSIIKMYKNIERDVKLLVNLTRDITAVV